MPLAVDIAHLYKSYGSFLAVKDFTLKVAAGSCCALLGPNGAGKTTAVKTIYGKAAVDRHPETPIEVFGHDPRIELLKVKVLVGIVSQENNLDSELNVQQNLDIYALFCALPRPVARARIDELLTFMELKDRHAAQVRELSGGMKRRLTIARALINNPQLLILDEPTTGLDLQVRQLIWDRLRQLMSQGVTVLVTTHYMEEAYQLADNIVIMNTGAKILEGPPAHLIRTHLEKYVMETQQLLPLKHSKPAVHHEQSGGRHLYYCASDTTLQRIAATHHIHQYYIRESNLEDLFLRSTGRSLHANQ